ncbi:hypothetical protein MPH_12291 [Macrophomina phaseolina MS6]|uniref:Uncharacterized protein n=1 Tax=Macrophomina phaseolina (strain MS6) TaxID=1126212 RepID=K2S1L8_MACPH|nr:hypothetical protein MPH_12291 [Macrophomina phaseolina MS6]
MATAIKAKMVTTMTTSRVTTIKAVTKAATASMATLTTIRMATTIRTARASTHRMVTTTKVATPGTRTNITMTSITTSLVKEGTRWSHSVEISFSQCSRLTLLQCEAQRSWWLRGRFRNFQRFYNEVGYGQGCRHGLLRPRGCALRQLRRGPGRTWISPPLVTGVVRR